MSVWPLFSAAYGWGACPAAALPAVPLAALPASVRACSGSDACHPFKHSLLRKTRPLPSSEAAGTSQSRCLPQPGTAPRQPSREARPASLPRLPGPTRRLSFGHPCDKPPKPQCGIKGSNLYARGSLAKSISRGEGRATFPSGMCQPGTGGQVALQLYECAVLVSVTETRAAVPAPCAGGEPSPR